MADSSLKEALEDHGSTFSGLLSLLPAKVYYGEGQSSPYGKPKQSKAERKAAKRGRLDPDSAMNRTAEEELKERESHKRKLRELQAQDDAEHDEEENISLGSDTDVEKEAPREGLKMAPRDEPRRKKPKTAEHESNDEEKTDRQLAVEAKKKARKDAKKAKSAEKRKRREARIAALAAQATEQESQSTSKDAEDANRNVDVKEAPAADAQPQKSKDKAKKPKDTSKPKTKVASQRKSEALEGSVVEPSEVPPEQNSKDVGAPAQQAKANEPRTAEHPEKEESQPRNPQPTGEAVEPEPTARPAPKTADASQPGKSDAAAKAQPPVSAGSTPASRSLSPTFDAAEQTVQNAANNDAVSVSTSVSSTVPAPEKSKHIVLPENMDDFRERFQARLAALREQRKAPGTGDRPARSRKELMEQRQKKEAERKARKKEERRLAKLEEERKREEALAANSPGAMSPAAELDETTANLAFGRVTFNDNTQLSRDLSYVLNRDKKKGPSDPKTALLKLQNQKKRLADLDEEKREDVAEKEAWLTARRRAEGDKIRDDEAILKKAVKRKERQKRKSEREWGERAKGVEMAQKAKQKKREENLKKRKDEKLLRKIGGKKAIKKPGAAKPRHAFQGGLGNARR